MAEKDEEKKTLEEATPKERTDYRTVTSCCGSASSSDDEEDGFVQLKNWAKSSTEADDDSEAEFNQILELCRLKRETARKHAEAGPTAAHTRTDDKRPSAPRGGARRVFDDEYYTLPPTEDPAIHVQEDIQLKRFGVVNRLIDFIVNIKPDAGVPHLGYDTMLFDGERNGVGSIFEVFGPVCDTMYALRFNSAEEASTRLSTGTVVFYAPEAEGVFTKIILADELKKMKISDPAGRVHNDDSGSEAGSDGEDDEPAFSDDDEERLYHDRRRAKQAQRMRADQRRQRDSSSSTTGRGAVPPKRARGAMARGVAGFQRFPRPNPNIGNGGRGTGYSYNRAPHFGRGAPATRGPMPPQVPPPPMQLHQQGGAMGFVDYSRPPPPMFHQVGYSAPPPPPPPRQWTTGAATTMGTAPARPVGPHSSSARGGGAARGRQ